MCLAHMATMLSIPTMTQAASGTSLGANMLGWGSEAEKAMYSFLPKTVAAACPSRYLRWRPGYTFLLQRIRGYALRAYECARLGN